MKACTVDDCTQPHRARGLCSTHYNQTTRATVTVSCVACGRTVTKDREYANRRPSCSTQCRAYLQFGKTYCDVPDLHPSRSTPVPLDHPSRVAISCDVPPDHPSRQPLDRDCAWCSRNSGASRYCSRRCRQKAKRVRRLAAESDGRTYSWTHVIRVLMLLGGRCVYCDQLIDGPPDPDHVIPLSRYGSNGDGNILPACRSCNSDKRDLLLCEWADDRARRGKPAVRTTFNRSHPAFAHLLPTVLASGQRLASTA